MMLFKLRVWLPFTLCLMLTAFAFGQTPGELAAKYPVVSAYEVRPGILMTARYAADGQVCQMVLETRHYHRADEIDLGSTIPTKLEDRLIDELVPENERGKPTKSRWLNGDVGGGVTYTKRDFENVSIEVHGSYSCREKKSSKGQLSCDTGGDEVVVIHWKKRTCATPKANDTAKDSDTIDPATGNLHLTIPLVATTKPR